MRRYIVLFLQSLLLVGLASCSGGGGEDEADHPPAITNLRYSPAATQSTGCKTSIAVLADFADAGADVASARLTSTSGDDVSAPVTGLNGTASGTVSAPFAVSTDKAGKYSFDVWLVDGRGSVSNHLSGTYEILPPGPANAWITLRELRGPPLQDIAWRAGQYVAVGRLGVVMTSPDLCVWTQQYSGMGYDLNGVAMSASRIVAVGSDLWSGQAGVISSDDGATWSIRYQSSDCEGAACGSRTRLSRVIWTGEQFVAVGMERPVNSAMFYVLVLTSPDGITWTKRAPLAMPISDEWTDWGPSWVRSVAWSGNLFVVPTIDANWDPVVWTSPDAVTWTLSRDITTDAVWGMPFADVTWGNGRFVALDGPGANGDSPVFTSADGLRWLPDTTITNLPTMNAITSKPGEFVAVGATDVQTSQDGLNWTVSPLSGCGNGVLWDGTRYVAVGTSICKSQ